MPAERPLPRRFLNRGYQGVVYVIGEGPDRAVVKEPAGRGPLRGFTAWMLRREHAAYQRLAGLTGIPRCRGLLADGSLVLDFVEGKPFEDNATLVPDRSRFFAELLQIILAVHGAGVAHGDLKRRGNLLVTAEGRPVLLDFGTAACADRDGAFGRWLFRLLRRFDLNAWIKLKYRKQYDAIEPDDRQYFRPTAIELVARVVRQSWRRVTARRWRKARRVRRQGSR